MNRPLITDKAVDIEKQLVEVQDVWKIAHHLEESMEYTSN